METALFDFELPEHCIAQKPLEQRDQSRLFVIDRASGKTEHTTFDQLPQFLPQQAQLIRNNARVIKARLFAKRPHGGKVECLLLHPGVEPTQWWCLLKPGRKLPIGATFAAPGYFEAQVLEREDTGKCLVQFKLEPPFDSVIAMSERLGTMPLPPYIRRNATTQQIEDSQRYQTLYANPDKQVAAASPTAGLHFTKELLASCEEQGACFHDLTLHIGLGTFQPIQTDTLDQHQIHREFYEIPEATRALIDTPEGKPRIAVGTTAMRAIEDYQRSKPLPKGPIQKEADIFIYPGAQFAGVDSLITNFHLPRSTLICLVSAFLCPGETDGIKWLKELYKEAINLGYRFYSYGDAMLIL
tara:strand:+ start:6543 stop:7610 length:1068 start_codon:yes stop_codon:yes gene_type:complete